MEVKTTPTYRADIYLAGDLAVIEQCCREHCYRIGLCVTVSPTNFIYTGGQEAGVRVGLLCHPRFPKPPEELKAQARELAKALLLRTCQHSVLICCDDVTEWISVRDESPAAK